MDSHTHKKIQMINVAGDVVVDDENIVVEEVYDEEVDGMDEESLHGVELREQSYNDEDMYGGMSHEYYDELVEFKRSGAYPIRLQMRTDRSASCHFRYRSDRFLLLDDDETLMFHNPMSKLLQTGTSATASEKPKYVVKKGEVRYVLEKLHDLIGHLGQKRTQIVVLKRFYWRSVRQDVKTFVTNCEFCNQKKLEGKKIMKAPVDITSDSFDIETTIKRPPRGHQGFFERFSFVLIGYNETDVRAAAMTRMTTYTFKETASDLRSFTAKLPPVVPFRRTSYLSRLSRFQSGRNLGTRVLSTPYMNVVRRTDADEYLDYYATEAYRPEDDPDYMGELDGDEMTLDIEDMPGTSDAHDVKIDVEAHEENRQHHLKHSRRLRSRKRKRMNGVGGMSARFCGATSNSRGYPKIELIEGADGVTEESVQYRPEILGLTPVMMMTSADAEVIQLQKELLKRQLRIQELQEKVLQSQYEAMRVPIPIGRYEELNEHGEPIHIVNGHEVDHEFVMENDGQHRNMTHPGY